MWSELYAPRCEQDVAWSRVKYNALAALVSRVRDGDGDGDDTTAVLPPIHLLYGPTGCGKLSTLRLLLLRHYATRCDDDVYSGTGNGDDEDDVYVLHTCDVSVAAYRNVLQHILQLCCGSSSSSDRDGGGAVLREATLPLRARAAAHRHDDDDDGTTVTAVRIRESRSSDGQRSSGRCRPRRRAFVVKFYGERADEALQRCTADFVRAYEQLQQQQQQQQRLVGSDSRTPAPVTSPARPRARRAVTSLSSSQPPQPLQRQQHCVFFVHTTHDAHSDKVDLGASFPAAVLRSRAVVLFHCTAITPISLRRRLLRVLQCEQQRRRGDSNAVVVQSSRAAQQAVATVTRKRARSQRQDGSSSSRRRRNVNVVIDDGDGDSALVSADELDTVVATSQGDVRQALLQLQWLALVPPGQHIATTAAVSSRDKVDDNKDASRMQRPQYGDAAATSASTTRARTVVDLLDEHDTSPLVHDNNKNDNDNKDNDKDDDATLRAVARVALRDEYLCLSHATARLLTQKYTLTSVLRVVGAVSPRRVLDYVANNMPHYFDRTQMDAYAACAAAASAADALRARGAFATPRQHYTAASSLITGVATSSNGSSSAGNSRDDDGGDDANDGGAFASDFQLDRIALCVFDCSYRVHHRDVHTPRAFVAQRPPPYVRSAYPRLRPRRTQRRAWQQRQQQGGVYATAAASLATNVDDDDDEVTVLSEWQWQASVRARLAQHCRRHDDDDDDNDDNNDERSGRMRTTTVRTATRTRDVTTPSLPRLRSDDADLLRECLCASSAPLLCCGALDAVLLDYAPYAQRIVLQCGGGGDVDDADDVDGSDSARDKHNNSNNNNTLAAAAKTTTLLSATSDASRRGGVGGGVVGRRTTFRFAPSPPRSNNSNTRRCCTMLQYTLLCCGAPPHARLRSDAFVLCASAAAATTTTTTTRDGSDAALLATRPMLPPGVDIEEDDDDGSD